MTPAFLPVIRNLSELDNYDPLDLVPSAGIAAHRYCNAEIEERPLLVQPKRFPFEWDRQRIKLASPQAFCEAYSRMRYLTGCKNSKELGNFLGAPTVSFLYAYRDGHLPARWAVHIALCCNASLNWILDMPFTCLLPYEPELS